ncbi:hypothetical protein LCGC14_0548970 [marine sediment metagenome]|uniref:Uncharacterized protein n=1 Tax=marine sediment metagenome TaxID=412755 RepID=A0A0F9RV78_9ZZZZ
MSMYRAGAPVVGTVVNPGTDNSLTNPRIITFSSPVRPCWIRLTGAVQAATAPVLVKVNVEPPNSDGTVTDDFSTGTKAHLTLSSILETADLSNGGIVAIHSISIATQDGSDDLDDIMIAGFPN